jgi:RNA polymerase sigma-70 factor (ECF subfamily)
MTLVDVERGSADSGLADLENASAAFRDVRPRLFGIAYRMLGTVSDAEDLLQEIWLRWQQADRSQVANPAAYLATATTRLAINASQSARARRETYIGPWLPEPVDTSADPYLGAERDEALSVAVLLMLETLSPQQRAAYILREAFDYPYEQIATILETTEAAARQLISRARKHLRGERRTSTDSTQQRRLLEAFVAAARTGDLAVLEKLLADDAVSYSDGGGMRGASRIPVFGRTRVARYHRAFAARFWSGVDVEWAAANGATSAVLRQNGAVLAVLTVNVADGAIDRVMWVLSPAKIAALAAAVDARRT